ASVDASGATGWIDGDAVQVSATGSFADKHAGANKTVGLANICTGDNGRNCLMTDQASTTASISQKTITVSGITAADKVYDATTKASVDASGATGWIDGDAVQVSATGSFRSEERRVGKAGSPITSYHHDDVGRYATPDH